MGAGLDKAHGPASGMMRLAQTHTEAVRERVKASERVMRRALSLQEGGLGLCHH